MLISGSIFRDINGNGIKDSSEAALAGWRVWVDLDGDGIFDTNEPSALTDATGKSRISSVSGGTYRIEAFIPSGWAATLPGSATRKITLANGLGTTSNKNFGAVPVS